MFKVKIKPNLDLFDWFGRPKILPQTIGSSSQQKNTSQTSQPIRNTTNSTKSGNNPVSVSKNRTSGLDQSNSTTIQQNLTDLNTRSPTLAPPVPSKEINGNSLNASVSISPILSIGDTVNTQGIGASIPASILDQSVPVPTQLITATTNINYDCNIGNLIGDRNKGILPLPPITMSYGSYIAQFKSNSTGPRDPYRETIYLNNLKIINAHNLNTRRTFNMGLN